MPAATIPSPVLIPEKVHFLKKYRRQILAILLPAAVLALSLLVFGIRYDTNDDATLANIAAGAYGSDTIHMVYVNVLFAGLLRPFYAIYDSLNWYVIIQIVINYCCAVVLCDVCMQRFGVVAGALIDMAMLVGFGSTLLYRFQYVKNSMLWLVTGLLLIALYLGKKNSMQTAAGIVLALLGSLVRWQNFYAAGAMAACLLLFRFVPLAKPGKKRAVLTMALLFALVFGAHGVDLFSYRMDEGWNAYRIYNMARTEFSDFKTLALDPENNALAACDVSDNDYTLLCRWDFYDDTVFSAQRLDQFSAVIPSGGVEKTLRTALSNAISMVHGATWRYCFVLVILAGLVLLRLDRKCIAFYGTGVMMAALLVYLSISGRFPERVEIALQLAFCVFGLAAIGFGTPRKKAEVPAALCMFIAVCAFSAPKLMQQRAASVAYQEYVQLEEPYFDEIQSHPENLYLFSTESTSIIAGFDVWHARPQGFFDNIVVYGGWMSHTPSREDALAAYGLHCPLVDAIDRENVYLAYQGIDYAVTYGNEHGTGAAVNAIKCGENPLCPYQLVSTS